MTCPTGRAKKCVDAKIPLTTTDSVFCPGSKLAFVPVLEPGQGFRDKSLEAFVPGGRTGTKGV